MSNLRTPSQSEVFARRMAEKTSERTNGHLREIAIADETKAKAPLTILFDWYDDYDADELAQFARPNSDRSDEDHPEWKDEPFPDYYKIDASGTEINASFYDTMADDTPWGVVCVAHCDAIAASKVAGASCPDTFKRLDKSVRDFEWSWLTDTAQDEMGRVTLLETKWKKRRNRNRSMYRRAAALMFQETAVKSMLTVDCEYKTETDKSGAKHDDGTPYVVPSSGDKPIVVWDVNPEPGKPPKAFKSVGIATFLSYDVELAKLNGNNLSALNKTVGRGTNDDDVAIEEQEAVIKVDMPLTKGEAALGLLNHWLTPAVEKSLWRRLQSKKQEDSDDLAVTVYNLGVFFRQFVTEKMKQRVDAYEQRQLAAEAEAAAKTDKAA